MTFRLLFSNINVEAFIPG